MKNYLSIALCGMGILLALAGCKKDPSTIDNGNGAIKFIARNAGSGIATRTSYSGEGTLQDGKLVKERIDWTKGDEVLIWSNTAVVRENGSHPDYGESATHIATYTVNEKNIQTASPTESKTTLDDNAGYGLTFVDNNPANFWGIYPAGAVEKGEGKQPTAETVTFSIADTQESKVEGRVANPDMSNAVMLAYLEGAKPASSGASNRMDFYPAFTAFQFNIKTESDKNYTLKQVVLTSADGTTNIAGKVNATIASEGKSTFAEISEGSTSVTATFDSNPAISSTDDVTFTVLTAPVETGIVATFTVVSTVDGVETEITKSATLKQKNTAGEYEVMKFSPGKKYMINGLIIPANKDIEIILNYIPWDDPEWKDNENEITYVDGDAIANAVALEYSSGAAITSGGARRRENHFANATAPINAYFYVYSPVGAQWKIKVSGATEKLVVTSSTEGATKTDNEITGDINGRVDFTVTNNGASESDSIQINFYVVVKDEDGNEREISINSEITRRNALTITGKVG